MLQECGELAGKPLWFSFKVCPGRVQTAGNSAPHSSSISSSRPNLRIGLEQTQEGDGLPDGSPRGLNPSREVASVLPVAS